MAGFISEETIEKVKNFSDIVSVVSDYVHLTKKGGDFWGCCPFHNEKSASFHVIPDKSMYYCFGCHAGGNAIKFVQEMEKITFPEAITLLAKKQGIEIKYAEGSGPKEVQVDHTKEELIELYNRVASMFHYMLTQTENGKFALDYIKNRGITDETIEKFKLGYSPADRRWLKNFLKKKNFSDDFLAKSGLFSANYPDVAFFSDRLMFPIFDRRGECVAMGGRLLRGEGPKYLNSKDLIQYQKGETLFAFNFAKQSVREQKKVIFCEGYMDCIAYHQSGITWAVAPLGTALTEDQVKIIKGFVDTVYLSFDSDGAGQKATWKAILMCRKQNLTVRVIRLKGGKDPAEIMLSYGVENLTNQVNSAILDNDYLFDVLSHQYPIDTPEGKTKAALAFFPYIDALQSDIQKESCLEQMGQFFNIAPEALRKDFNNREKAVERVESRPAQKENQDASQQKVKLTAELRALLAVIADINQFELMRRELTENDFEDQTAKDLFIILEECYRQGDLSLSTILDHCQNQNMQRIITSSVASGEFSVNTGLSVHDSIVLIKKNSLEKRRTSILNQIRILQSSKPVDEQKLMQLLEEKMDLDQKLKIK